MESTPRLRTSEVLNCRAIECFHLDYSDANSLDDKLLTTLYQKEPMRWLFDELSLAEFPKTVSPEGCIRLIIIDFASLWVENKNPSEYLIESLDLLQISSAAYTEEDVIRYQKFPSAMFECGSKSSNQVARQSISCNTSGIASNFYSQTRTSVGVAWGMDGEGREEIDHMLSKAIELRSVISHPSLLSLLALQGITMSMREWISAQKLEVQKAQIDSGFHQYAHLKYGEVNREVELSKFSASVSGLSSNIVTSQLCLQGLHHLAMYIIKDNASLANDQNFANDHVMYRATAYIGQEVKYWADECVFLLQEAVSWQVKASVIIQGVFDLIAQRDQITNMNIAQESKVLAEQSQKMAHETKILAEETKKDSTSMKAIAAVTMFFLPGTFVAALFATPMFQWDPGLSQITSRHLWLYWAVVIPMTAATVSVWIAWDWLSNKNSKSSADEQKGG